MKLVTAVLNLDKPLLEAFFETNDGKLRKVEVGWEAREFVPIPPADWLKMAETEMSFQDGERLAEAQGRIVPPPKRPGLM